MKRYAKYAVFVLLVLTLFWPSTAYAKEPFDDKVVFGGTYTLESGQSLDGNLVIFGGAVTTEAGSSVNGDIVLLGGVAEVAGTVNGNFVGIGGAVQLIDTAVVNGDLVTIGATLSRDEGARVNGQIVNGMETPFTFTIPDDLESYDYEYDVPVAPHPQRITWTENPLVEMLWYFFTSFMWALLAVLVVIFFTKPTERVAKTAISQPLVTAGAGLLTALLTPMALIALTLTIILIPVTFVATLVLLVAWMFGWVALGLEVGRRIADLFNAEWAPAVSAGVGTFILFLVLGGFDKLIPCVGWLPQVLVGIWGLGAVVMTRFGTQEYPLESVQNGDTPVVVETNLPEVIVPQIEESGAAETVVAPVDEADPTPEVATEEPVPEDDAGSDDDSEES